MEKKLIIDIKFLPCEIGGRRKMPPIKDNNYTYRPIVYANHDFSRGFCCGIVIKKTMDEIIPNKNLENMEMFLLNPQKNLSFFPEGTILDFSEGMEVIAQGIVKKIVYEENEQ